MSEYTGKEIVVLEGLEAVRKRPCISALQARADYTI